MRQQAHLETRTRTFAETVFLVTPLREASEADMARIWLLSYVSVYQVERLESAHRSDHRSQQARRQLTRLKRTPAHQKILANGVESSFPIPIPLPPLPTRMTCCSCITPSYWPCCRTGTRTESTYFVRLSTCGLPVALLPQASFTNAWPVGRTAILIGGRTTLSSIGLVTCGQGKSSWTGYTPKSW